MPSASGSLPSDLAAAHAMIFAERSARLSAAGKLASACSELVEARAEAANGQADRSSHEAPIADLKLENEKLRREIYGQRSERKARLLEQMELHLEEVEALRDGRQTRRGESRAEDPDGALF
jgi:transposase